MKEIPTPDRCIKVKGKISDRNGEKSLIVEASKGVMHKKIGHPKRMANLIIFIFTHIGTGDYRVLGPHRQKIQF